MNEFRYLVDNNALSLLTSAQRTSSFFRENCRITGDVLYEARGYVETELARLEYSLTPACLTCLIEVMATAKPGDTSLVDLYANKGAADPMMVACALDAQAREDDTLIPNTWIIVTDDKALDRTATALGLTTLHSMGFRALLPQ